MDYISEGVPPISRSMDHRTISYDLEDLNQNLLEKNPQRYFDALNCLSNQYPVEVIREILNQSIEDSWFSNHVLALALLVGKLINNDSDRPFGCFYGSELKDGISEELGIKILDKMMSLGVDLWALNYYDDSIITVINNGELLGGRCCNDHFKAKVREYYNREEN